MELYNQFLGDTSQSLVPVSRDYLGGVQLLQKNGFSPFTNKDPLNSTLNQVFNEFSSRTGLDIDENEINRKFKDQNTELRRATNLYDALEDTFSPSSQEGQPKIIEFINQTIDDYVVARDQNKDQQLNAAESGVADEIFSAVDANLDKKLSPDEIKNQFYENYQPLNNILNYFQANTGKLVDIYA